jgi:hypothetical protein
MTKARRIIRETNDECEVIDADQATNRATRLTRRYRTRSEALTRVEAALNAKPK